MEKCRLDQMLVNKGMITSREKGKALIMTGKVYVNGIQIDKPGTSVTYENILEIRGDLLPYVSRGGLKLEKALVEYHIDLHNKIMIDVGASTGGFTDCALKNGASKVYAVDVGYGQLDWSLRQDSRVVVLERMNARFLTHENISENVDIITIDVAFISLKKILQPLYKLLNHNGYVIALIKPQFEAGREFVGKNGVIKDPAVHCKVISEIVDFSTSMNFILRGLTYSPIKGPKGNIEFLIWLQKGNNLTENSFSVDIKELVNNAHNFI